EWSKPHQRLVYFSIEKDWIPTDERYRVLDRWPELQWARDLFQKKHWPHSLEHGFHVIEQGAVTLILALGDVEWGLSQWMGSADIWYLDGFSPQKNPEMWSEEVCRKVAVHSSLGTRVTTFSSAGW